MKELNNVDGSDDMEKKRKESMVTGVLSKYGISIRSTVLFLYAVGSIILVVLPWIILVSAIRDESDLKISSNRISIFIIVLTMFALAKYARASEHPNTLASDRETTSSIQDNP